MTKPAVTTPEPAHPATDGNYASAQIRLGDMTGHLLRRLENRASAWYYKVVGATEITPRQFAVLLTLYRHGRMSQGELATRTLIDRSTLAEMTQRMVERGFIRRRIPSDNRRTREMSIAREGKAALLQILPRAALSQRLMLEPLPPEYRRIFRHCLEVLLEAELEADAAAVSTPTPRSGDPSNPT